MAGNILLDKSKDYVIAMDDSFHTPLLYGHYDDHDNYVPSKEDKCEVCFAGAVLANTIKMEKNEEFCDLDFSNDVYNKVNALDSFRQGYIEDGLDNLGYNIPEYLARDVEITPYYVDRAKFKKDMANMAKVFEKFGL